MGGMFSAPSKPDNSAAEARAKAEADAKAENERLERERKEEESAVRRGLLGRSRLLTNGELGFPSQLGR
jgi:ribosomal protein L12E/L44/L45/RPP1/RPP2